MSQKLQNQGDEGRRGQANRKIEEKISYHDCALQKVKELDQFESNEY